MRSASSIQLCSTNTTQQVTRKLEHPDAKSEHRSPKKKKKLHEKVNFFCFCGKEKEAHRGTAAPGGVCGGARRNSWRRIAGDRRRPRSVTVSRRAGTACCTERERKRESCKLQNQQRGTVCLVSMVCGKVCQQWCQNEG